MEGQITNYRFFVGPRHDIEWGGGEVVNLRWIKLIKIINTSPKKKTFSKLGLHTRPTNPTYPQPTFRTLPGHLVFCMQPCYKPNILKIQCFFLHPVDQNGVPEKKFDKL